MDLAVLVNAPREITLAGKTFLVSALTLSDWGTLSAFLKDHSTDPVVAALDQLSKAKASGVVVADEDRKALFESARRDARSWPPRVGSQEWFDLMLWTEGASEKFLACVLRKHQTVTDAELARVNSETTPEESRLLIHRALGLEPSPKADAPAAGAGATAEPTGPTSGPEGSTPSPPTG